MPDYRPIMKLMCQAHGIPEPEAEFRFHPYRRWKLDFVWLAWSGRRPVALEIEGGAWTGGRHTRGSGFVKDMEKYNEAALHGYLLLRCTPQQLRNFDVAPLIKRALGLL